MARLRSNELSCDDAAPACCVESWLPPQHNFSSVGGSGATRANAAESRSCRELRPGESSSYFSVSSSSHSSSSSASSHSSSESHRTLRRLRLVIVSLRVIFGLVFVRFDFVVFADVVLGFVVCPRSLKRARSSSSHSSSTSSPKGAVDSSSRSLGSSGSGTMRLRRGGGRVCWRRWRWRSSRSAAAHRSRAGRELRPPPGSARRLVRTRSPALAGLGAAHRFPIFDRDHHFAGLRAVVLADDAVLGHEVDQPRRPAVADAQRPLQQRHAAAPLADHDVDRRFVQLVAVLAARRRPPRLRALPSS